MLLQQHYDSSFKHSMQSIAQELQTLPGYLGTYIFNVCILIIIL